MNTGKAKAIRKELAKLGIRLTPGGWRKLKADPSDDPLPVRAHRAQMAATRHALAPQGRKRAQYKPSETAVSLPNRVRRKKRALRRIAKMERALEALELEALERAGSDAPDVEKLATAEASGDVECPLVTGETD